MTSLAHSKPEVEENKYEIHEACREGQVAKVQSLLNANPKLAKLHDEDERLPLHWAVANNRVEIVHLLIDDRTDIDINAQDSSGWTPLMIASSHPSASPTLLPLLLSKDASVSLKSSAGQTALHFASSRANLESVQLLLSHSASPKLKDKRGVNPLHRAASVGTVTTVRALLDSDPKSGSWINATDQDGWTALHHAIAEGHGDVAMELLKRGADAKKANGEGVLPKDVAPDEKVRNFIVQSAEREGYDLGS